MKFFGRRSGDTLIADSVEDAAELAKIPHGKPLMLEVKSSRSISQHRLYWAIMRRVASGLGMQPENVSDVLKLKTGQFRAVQTKEFGLCRFPDSISFASMDGTEFSAYMDRCITLICEEWAIARPDLMDMIKDLIVPTEQRG